MLGGTAQAGSLRCCPFAHVLDGLPPRSLLRSHGHGDRVDREGAMPPHASPAWRAAWAAVFIPKAVRSPLKLGLQQGGILTRGWTVWMFCAWTAMSPSANHVRSAHLLQLHLGNPNKAASEPHTWSRRRDRETEAPFFLLGSTRRGK